jgi:hypothetical protein
MPRLQSPPRRTRRVRAYRATLAFSAWRGAARSSLSAREGRVARLDGGGARQATMCKESRRDAGLSL